MNEGKVVGLKALRALGALVVIIVIAIPTYLFLFSGPDYCGEIEEMKTDPIKEFSVQIVGDSVFNADADGCASVAGFMSLRLWLPVEDNSVPGATITGNEGIPEQYISGDWNWTIIDGGGNDIMPYCTEEDCDEILDEMMSDSGNGLIPDLVEEAKNDGSNVILIGYYSVPRGSEFEPVVLEIEILNDRYSEFAKANENVYFISLKDVMEPESTPEYYSDDLVHPSLEGSEAIGEHIANFIIDEHKKETGKWFR